MYVGALWLKRRVADVNGFRPLSPDDLHPPVSEAGPQQPGQDERHADHRARSAAKFPDNAEPQPGRP
jgi:hypothetical protein